MIIQTPHQIVADVANGVRIDQGRVELGMILCELRGTNPFEPVELGGHVGSGVTLMRWQAAIAELRIIAAATHRGGV
jgi:hypothetical protein